MIFDLSHSQWATQWQLVLQECAAWWRSNRNREDLLDRLIDRMESYYIYEPTRMELEQFLKECKDPFILKVWNIMLLLCVCQNLNGNDIKLQYHWIKLWSDHYFRLHTVRGIKMDWSELREILLQRGEYSQFHTVWIHLMDSYARLLTDQNVKYKTMYGQVMTHKMIVLLNLNLHMIHPTVLCQRHMDAFHWVPNGQRQYSPISVAWDTVIPSSIIREQNRQSSLLLPLIHCKNKHISTTMLLMNKLNTLIIQIQSYKRGYLQELYIQQRSQHIIHKMKMGSRYYSQRSSYTDNFKDYYDLLINHINNNKIHIKHSINYLNRLLEDDNLFDILSWQINVYKVVGWIPDNLFQNIGFTLIPNNRMQIREDNWDKKYIPDNYLHNVMDMFSLMYRNDWGNINQRTSIYLFLSNCNLKFFREREGLYLDWMSDPRYCASSNPLWNTTQSFNTNMRILFHLMKQGWYPREQMSNFIYLIVQQLNVMKNRISSYAQNPTYQRDRLEDTSIYRKLRMSVDTDFDAISTKVSTLYSLVNDNVMMDFTYQDFLCCLVNWIEKIDTIPQLSFFQLEETLRECWNMMQSHYNYIEKTPEFCKLNIQATLMKNPIWSRNIIVNMDQKLDILEWWKLHSEDYRESDEDEDETLDAITRMRMESPVRLPSGSMVDRSTYIMLLQTSGKDPFTMVDLPSLSSSS